MQQGDVQITLVAGLECPGGDAVAEVELVVPEGFDDVRPRGHHQVGLLVAGGQYVRDGGLQRDLATHHRGIDPVDQQNDLINRFRVPGVGEVGLSVGRPITSLRELEAQPGSAVVFADRPASTLAALADRGLKSDLPPLLVLLLPGHRRELGLKLGLKLLFATLLGNPRLSRVIVLEQVLAQIAWRD